MSKRDPESASGNPRRNLQLPAVAQPAARDVSSPPGKRRPDRIDEPARPLGSKRAALQLRRQRNGAARVTTKPNLEGKAAPGLLSNDGSVRFVMRALPSGLLIERTQREANGTRLVQCLVFGDTGTFERWCESDQMRFEDPVLYDQLRREGHGAFGGER